MEHFRLSLYVDVLIGRRDATFTLDLDANGDPIQPIWTELDMFSEPKLLRFLQKHEEAIFNKARSFVASLTRCDYERILSKINEGSYVYREVIHEKADRSHKISAEIFFS